MTLSEILSEIKRGLKEPETGGHWTDTELLRRINIGQRKIVRYTGCLQKVSTSTTSIATIQEYSKPSDCLRITRVSYSNKRIIGIPISDLDEYAESRGGVDWALDSGTPTNYYERIDKLGLYPIPNSTGDIIKIEYIYTPSDLSSLTDVPFNSVTYLYDYHELLISYVLWKCLLEDQQEIYSEHKNNFIQGMEDLRRQILNKPDEIVTFGLKSKRSVAYRSPIPGIILP